MLGKAESELGFGESVGSSGKGTADTNDKFPAKINKDKTDEITIFGEFFIKFFTPPILINF